MTERMTFTVEIEYDDDEVEAYRTRHVPARSRGALDVYIRDLIGRRLAKPPFEGVVVSGIGVPAGTYETEA